MRRKKHCGVTLILLLILFQFTFADNSGLPGFSVSPYFEEQYATFNFEPQVRVHVNAPSIADYNSEKPITLAIFALPNGNTIEQTVGKLMQNDTDWHYNIQHIGAQTRWLRNKITDTNLIVAFVEAEQKSWPTWKSQTANYAAIVKKLVEYLKTNYEQTDVDIVMTGHSGGGRFIFSFMDAFNTIPEYVKRICFLDSNYGYDDSYGAKLKTWLEASEENALSVIAYNDNVALYNGQPIVSATGGTWYRSKMMKRYLENFFNFTTDDDSDLINHQALNGRISIILKTNPEQAILHTVQVERNGFIHTMLTGTDLENQGYIYYGDHVYDDLIQSEEIEQTDFQIPLRSAIWPNGEQFMNSIKNLEFAEREDEIFKQFIYGNMPWFYRKMVTIETNFNDNSGTLHTVQYEVMPDYLAVGCDTNFCRVPMGPICAQKIADYFGCILPTRKLVDNIYTNCEIKLAPVTYAPVGNENEKVEKFILHNEAITQQFSIAGGVHGQLTGGTKKDVIISNRLSEITGKVIIYGWHQLNGDNIQPLYTGHINSYVDYSHGIRLLKSTILLDGEEKSIQSILRDPVLYKILSDESGIMEQTSYLGSSDLPDKPSSFGVRIIDSTSVKIHINRDTGVYQYYLYTSLYGQSFDFVSAFTDSVYTLSGLTPGKIIYIRLRAENGAGLSDFSEVLGAVPADQENTPLLIVNGFDRPTNGNNFDFIRYHGTGAREAGRIFESATNEAVLDGLFDLNDYAVVDYILGDESTADETFSDSEQVLVKNYLHNGGSLFVSGSEIAWDLDYKGSSTDKSFFYNYLKAKYSADAPGNESGQHYTASGTSGGIFDGINDILFDDGTHGTMNIQWADALIPYGGSEVAMTYNNVSTHKNAAIIYEGPFGDSAMNGRLAYMGFPLESIYTTSVRNEVMARVLDFLNNGGTNLDPTISQIPQKYNLAQNYPNPFNASTTIKYDLMNNDKINISIFDLSGRLVQELVTGIADAGQHQVTWNAANHATGVYFIRLTGPDYSFVKKMMLLK